MSVSECSRSFREDADVQRPAPDVRAGRFCFSAYEIAGAMRVLEA